MLDLISATTERRDKLEWNTTYWRKLLTEAGFDIKKALRHAPQGLRASGLSV